MALGGKQAKLLKTQFAKILTRYFAGDSTMVPELEANAASAAPTNVLALEAVGSKRVCDTDDKQLRLVRQTREELDKMVVVSDALGSNLAQQKADAVFMLDVVEKTSVAQLKAAETKQNSENGEAVPTLIECSGRASSQLGEG